MIREPFIEMAITIREIETRIRHRMAADQIGEAFQEESQMSTSPRLSPTATFNRPRMIQAVTVNPSRKRFVFASVAGIAIVLASVAMASAQSITTTCYRSNGAHSCTSRYQPAPRPAYSVQQVAPVEETAEDRADRAERIRKWEDFCKPTFRTDAYGVRRAVYAHAGCELGRSE